MSQPQQFSAKQLSLATVPLIDDGIIAKQFDALIAAAVHDCEQRSGVNKARKVVLEMSLTPETNPDGSLRDVVAGFNMSTKGPGYGPVECKMLLRQGDRLLFQPLSPDDPRQDPLPLDTRVDPETGEILEE